MNPKLVSIPDGDGGVRYVSREKAMEWVHETLDDLEKHSSPGSKKWLDKIRAEFDENKTGGTSYVTGSSPPKR